MTKIFFILLITIPTVVIGQLRPLSSPPKKPPTEKQMHEDETNHNCLHRNKYTPAQRLQFYPFNKAVQVKLVAFDNKPTLTIWFLAMGRYQ